MGFFLYCFGVAYLVEENLPNPEIAKGFSHFPFMGILCAFWFEYDW